MAKDDEKDKTAQEKPRANEKPEDKGPDTEEAPTVEELAEDFPDNAPENVKAYYEADTEGQEHVAPKFDF